MKPATAAATIQQQQERLTRAATVLPRVLAAIDDLDGTKAARTDTQPANNPDWCVGHDRVIDARCIAMMCDGVPTASAPDPVGDAATASAPHHADRKAIVKHIKAIERALDRLADVAAKYPPPPSPQQRLNLQAAAEKETIDKEAGLCKVCVELGDTTVQVDSRNYSSLRLCRKHGDVRNILRGVKAVTNPDVTLPKLARLMRDRGHTHPTNADIASAAGVALAAVEYKPLRKPKVPQGWHTQDDYMDTTGMVEAT